MRVETKVGIFVVLAIVMLFGLTTQVGSFQFGKQDGYPIFLQLSNANGLEKNAKVKSRGINIGYVESFQLKKNSIEVQVIIGDRYKIPKNSIVSIKQESMLGVKYIDIEFSSGEEYLQSLESLSNTKEYASFDEMSESLSAAAISFQKLSNRLDNLVAKNEENFTKLITNFKEVGEEFKQTGIELNSKLPKILDKFDTVGDEFAQTGKTINKKLPKILDKFEKIEDGFQEVIDDNKHTLKSAIKNVDSAFAGVDKAAVKVESSFDKLDKYLSSTTKSTLGIDIKTESLQKDQFNKSYFALDYSPKPTIHYMLDVVSTDDYRDDGTGEPQTTKKHEKGRTLISAQYGKDFGNFRFRGGFIENTGGFGIDYYMFNKRLKYSLEAYDFNAYNDVRGENTHLKTYLEYTMKKHILLYTGYDNFLNEDATNLFFGIGVRFEDNDLKYLIGSSAASLK